MRRGELRYKRPSPSSHLLLATLDTLSIHPSLNSQQTLSASPVQLERPPPTMFSTTSLTTVLTALLTLTSAAPSSFSPRQGGAYYAVGELYSGGGCTNLIFGDPIFTANRCVLLDRSGSVPDIVSYKLTSASAGCTGKSTLGVDVDEWS